MKCRLSFKRIYDNRRRILVSVFPIIFNLNQRTIILLCRISNSRIGKYFDRFQCRRKCPPKLEFGSRKKKPRVLSLRRSSLPHSKIKIQGLLYNVFVNKRLLFVIAKKKTKFIGIVYQTQCQPQIKKIGYRLLQNF